MCVVPSTERCHPKSVAIHRALPSTERCHPKSVAIQRALPSTERCHPQSVAIQRALPKVHLLFSVSPPGGYRSDPCSTLNEPVYNASCLASRSVSFRSMCQSVRSLCLRFLDIWMIRSAIVDEIRNVNIIIVRQLPVI